MENITSEEWRTREKTQVTESWRVVIRCTYNADSARITVSRYENGRDPNRMKVARDYSMNMGENYAHAVREYVARAGDGWGGHWRIGTTPTGAVAVWVGHSDEVTVSL